MKGYFGEKSMFWRVWKERIQILGGGRAIVLQLSHPLVAAGVAKYSNFQTDPLERLNRTLDTMLTIVFADKKAADKSLEKLNRVHGSVKGVLSQSLGSFKKGFEYNALDPELKLWVFATLMDTGLLMHKKYVGPLNRSQQEQFYKDCRLFAKLLQIPEEIVPKDLESFQDYMKEMYRSGVILATPLSKKLVKDIFKPKVPRYLKPVVPIVNAITYELLPEFLREEYKIKWTKADQIKTEQLAIISKVLLPFLPQSLRFMSQYNDNI